jgi:hypothetical protein
MTELLNKAFAEAAKLPDGEQEALAAWILAELASERRWANSLDHSQDALSRWADEALTEHHRKATRPLDLLDR